MRQRNVARLSYTEMGYMTRKKVWEWYECFTRSIFWGGKLGEEEAGDIKLVVEGTFYDVTSKLPPHSYELWLRNRESFTLGGLDPQAQKGATSESLVANEMARLEPVANGTGRKLERTWASPMVLTNFGLKACRRGA